VFFFRVQACEGLLKNPKDKEDEEPIKVVKKRDFFTPWLRRTKKKNKKDGWYEL
jgi:hypothetical protein